MQDRHAVFSYEDTAASAWDAALCAVQSKIFADVDKQKTLSEISEILSTAHSWHKEEGDES